MRRTAPLILGAGPAGCIAAATMARAGHEPLLLDRHAEAPDALCGGFLSWRTAERLAAHGLDLPALGAKRVEQLTLYCGSRRAELALPAPAFALSRGRLDGRLRELALAAGARLEVDVVREIGQDAVQCASGERRAETIFLATGKYDARGARRPHEARDPAMGLRLRLPVDDALAQRLAGRIELHLFRGGYAGLVLQEDGSANLCLALRKSRLADAGGEPAALLTSLVGDNPALTAVIEQADAMWKGRIEAIGVVPYGFIARRTEHGLFRIGDQAAVIPSLAGEGIDIAIASADLAARSWLAGGGAAAGAYQREFAGRAAGAVRWASLLWRLAEGVAGARALLALANRTPFLAGAAMRASRV